MSASKPSRKSKKQSAPASRATNGAAGAAKPPATKKKTAAKVRVSAAAAPAPAVKTAPKTAAKSTRAAAPSATPATSPSDSTTMAQAASASLQQIAASLTFYDPTAKDLIAARAANRVPIPALIAAANILEENPERYADFDASTVRTAADYAGAMAPVAAQMQELQQRLSKSIFNLHGQGATETLALYQTIKGLARLPTGKGALTQQKALAKLMVKSAKKTRATSVTQKELKGAAKNMKLAKVSSAKAKQAAVLDAEAQLAAATQAAAAGGTAAIASASQSAPPPSAGDAATAASPPVTTTAGH